MCRLTAACVTLSSAAASEKLACRPADSNALRAFKDGSRRAIPHVTKPYIWCKALSFVLPACCDYVLSQQNSFLEERDNDPRHRSFGRDNRGVALSEQEG